MHLQINFSYNDYFRVPSIQIGIDDIVLFDGPVCLHVEFELKLVKGTHIFGLHIIVSSRMRQQTSTTLMCLLKIFYLTE